MDDSISSWMKTLNFKNKIKIKPKVDPLLVMKPKPNWPLSLISDAGCGNDNSCCCHCCHYCMKTMKMTLFVIKGWVLMLASSGLHVWAWLVVRPLPCCRNAHKQGVWIAKPSLVHLSLNSNYSCLILGSTPRIISENHLQN
jgi:hypothetical protein